MTLSRALGVVHPNSLTSALLGDPPRIRRIPVNIRKGVKRKRELKGRVHLMAGVGGRTTLHGAKRIRYGGRRTRNGTREAAMDWTNKVLTGEKNRALPRVSGALAK